MLLKIQAGLRDRAKGRVWIAGVALLASAQVGMANPDDERANREEAFNPPTTPLILSRTLLRPLPGGQPISVTRRYAIRFSKEDSGFILEGKLLDVTVDAPAQLADLAAIERDRPDQALFPARLDWRGRVLTADRASPEPDTLRRALTGASAVLSASRLAPTEKRELSDAVKTVGNASALSVWPPFLFNPGPQERTTRQQVSLADGSSGEVEVRIRASEVRAGGLAHRVERSVTTRIANSERTTHEIWTITSAE